MMKRRALAQSVMVMAFGVLASAPGVVRAQPTPQRPATAPAGQPAPPYAAPAPGPVAAPAPGYPAQGTPATGVAQPYPGATQPYPAPAPQPYPYATQPPAGYSPAAPPPYYYAQPDLRPRRLPYEEGQEIPPGYHVEKRVRPGQVITGSILFGAAYLPLLYVAALSDFDSDYAWLALPLVGPWVAAARIPRDSCNSSTTTTCAEDSVNDFGRGLLIADGIVQAVGAGLFIWGINGRNMLIRNDYAQVTFTPGRLGSSGYGALLSGRF